MRIPNYLGVIFIAVSFFLLGLNGISQSDTSVWEMVEREGGIGAPKDMFAYVAMGDTLFDGRTFQKLWKFQYEKDGPVFYQTPPYEISDTSLVGYLYRDSTKIEVIITGSAVDFCPYDELCKDSLITMYSFDLEVGDSLAIPCNDEWQDSVINVIPGSANNGKKQIELSQYGYTYKITEDIGSEFGLFNRCFPIAFEEDKFELLQYCENFDSCQLNAIVSGIERPSISDLGIKIFPNPSSNYLNFEWEISVASYSVLLRDLLGRVHLGVSNLDGKQTQINVSDIAAGVYFLEIRKDQRIVGRKKVVIQ